MPKKVDQHYLSAKDKHFATFDRALEQRAKTLGAFSPVALHTTQ